MKSSVTGICFKCNEESAGKVYQVFYGKKIQGLFNESSYFYADIRHKEIFLCDSCILMHQRKNAAGTLVIFGLIGLCAGFYSVLNIEIGTNTLIWIIGFSIACILFAIYYFVSSWRSPARAVGEQIAFDLQSRQLTGEGFSVWKGLEFDSMVAKDRNLLNQISDKQNMISTKIQNIDITDMQAIRNYCHYLAVQWWQKNNSNTAICDGCNGQVSKDSGFIIGSNFYCHSCSNDKLGDEMLYYIRSDPNFFGVGILEKARAFTLQNKSLHRIENDIISRCPNCNAATKAKALFCTKCGAKL